VTRQLEAEICGTARAKKFVVLPLPLLLLLLVGGGSFIFGKVKLIVNEPLQGKREGSLDSQLALAICNCTPPLAILLMKRFFSENAVRIKELLTRPAHLQPRIYRTKEILALQPKAEYRIPQVKPFESFEEIPGISAEFLQCLQERGWQRPTQLQGSFLYHFFGAKTSDLLMKGSPGSGKSIGYLIALMSTLRMSTLKQPCTAAIRHLILVPTEQLQKQLIETLASLSSSNQDQSAQQILVTQPDSLSVKLAQGLFNWRALETVVLDEADALIKPLKRYSTFAQKRSRYQHPVPTLQLLSQLWSLFRGDRIRRDLRPRLVVCSATLDKGTKHDLTESKITHEGGRACVSIDLPETEGTRVKHHKHLLLSDAQNVDELITKLAIPLQQRGDGKKVAILLPAEQSKIGLISLLKQRFVGVSFGLLSEGWQGDVEVLVGSDVDVRGLNIPDLQHVIILDLPRSLSLFKHMAGRVGRSFNPDGTVWTLLGTAQDYEKYSSMMSQLGLTSLPVCE
jgi:superfamily II DNA/RNA helicase